MKTFEKSFIKNQSAMEYLMTYGWSILIVAVVLGALSFLGVFNPMTFTPKASAGGCQVIRNTELGVSNLEGSCNNQVPQYVAQFNGKSSYITTALEDAPHSWTISAWFEPSNSSPGSGSNCVGYPIVDSDNGNYGTGFGINGGLTALKGIGNKNCFSGLSSISGSPHTWYNAILTYDTQTNEVNAYLNGKELGPESFTFSSSGSFSYFYIGFTGFGCCNAYFNGSVANVQIYNTTFTNSRSEILYQEGIGGVPIDPQNLVGWWPLNGDANDYSGNQKNGVLTNVVFTSSWYNGYSQP
jgi:hypothetical protein